jgi:hypothetical protein
MMWIAGAVVLGFFLMLWILGQPPKEKPRGVWEQLIGRAAEFARLHAGEKIRDPAPATIVGLRKAISQAIYSQMDAIELQDDLVKQFNLPAPRALMIARTEMSRAFAKAKHDMARSGRINLVDLNLAGEIARGLSYPHALREARAKRNKPGG